MASEMIDKWEVVSKLITLQNNYNFFKNEWDAERLYREIAKLEIEVGKTQGLEVVRCKDCKHRAIGDNVCIHPNRIGDGYIEVKDNDFCSYGERREGEWLAEFIHPGKFLQLRNFSCVRHCQSPPFQQSYSIQGNICRTDGF